MGLPLIEKRDVPSGIRPLPWVTRIFWQRLVLPDLQYSHSPHSGVYNGITWSPGLTLVTPAPTSSTMPPPPCPTIPGNKPSGSAPDRVNASVWQTPVATMRTKTSPAFGPARSTSSMLRGLPASQATAAFVFIGMKLREDFCFFMRLQITRSRVRPHAAACVPIEFSVE